MTYLRVLGRCGNCPVLITEIVVLFMFLILLRFYSSFLLKSYVYTYIYIYIKLEQEPSVSWRVSTARVHLHSCKPVKYWTSKSIIFDLLAVTWREYKLIRLRWHELHSQKHFSFFYNNCIRLELTPMKIPLRITLGHSSCIWACTKHVV